MAAAARLDTLRRQLTTAAAASARPPSTSNAPDAPEGQQDFIKGWPNPDLLERPELKRALAESFAAGLEHMGSALNYGSAAEGAHMLGHPRFLGALGAFLTRRYGRPVAKGTLMSTAGCSMGVDLVARVHAAAGDVAVTEAPTFYLSHQVGDDGDDDRPSVC